MLHRLRCVSLRVVMGLSTLSVSPVQAEVRVETAMGVDSNVRRTESEPSRVDGFVRLILAADGRTRISRTCRLSARYHGGARHFSTERNEDTVVQRADAQVGCRMQGAQLGVSGYVRDRFTRAAAYPRDFSHAAIQLPIRLPLSDLELSIVPSIGRFHFKPDGRYSAMEAGARLTLGWRTGRWQMAMDGGYTQRRFTAPNITDEGGASQRVDDRLRIGGRIRYVGRFVGEVSGGFVENDSPIRRGGYRRQDVALSVTTVLGQGVLASTKLTVIRILHDQAQRLPDDLLLDDEGRTALTLRLEKPLDAGWSLVMHGGYWTSPFDTGPEYERVQGIVGLSHRK